MYRLLLASLTLGAAPAAFAQDAFTQLDAHVHGASDLAIAIDPADGLMVVELSGPAYNIYGFETYVDTEAAAQTVLAAHGAVLRGDLFDFGADAGCRWVDAAIDGGPALEWEAENGSSAHLAHDHGHDHSHDHEHGHDHEGHEHTDGHNHHDHDHEDHDHGHDDHGHDHDGHDPDAHDHGDHGDSHDHDHGEHGHSSMTVRWQYQCEAPAELTRIEASAVFAALPNLETLDAQFFDGERAASRQLNAQRSALVID